MKYYNSYINMFTYIIKLKSKLFYFYIYSSSNYVFYFDMKDLLTQRSLHLRKFQKIRKNLKLSL